MLLFPPFGYRWLASHGHKAFGTVRVEGRRLVRRRRFPIHFSINDFSSEEEQVCDYLVKVVSCDDSKMSRQWRLLKSTHRRSSRLVGPRKSNRLAKREREPADPSEEDDASIPTYDANNSATGYTENVEVPPSLSAQRINEDVAEVEAAVARICPSKLRLVDDTWYCECGTCPAAWYPRLGTCDFPDQ